jgi:hypothetical protein
VVEHSTNYSKREGSKPSAGREEVRKINVFEKKSFDENLKK